MIKLQELMCLCKCEISININPNKNYYQTPIEYLEELCNEEIKDIDKDVLNEIIKRDTLIIIQLYPKTPVGFGLIIDYDIENALNRAIEFAKNY